MSSPDSGQLGPGAPRRPSPARTPQHAAEAGTDPGRAQPYESLYRAGDGGAAGSAHRTTSRHFEPALTPPDGDEPDPEDTFHWLYRKEPAVDDAAPDATRVRPVTPPVPPSRPAVAADPLPDEAPPEPVRPGRRMVWVILALVLVLVAAGLVVAREYVTPTSRNASPPAPVSRADSPEPRTSVVSTTGATPAYTAPADGSPYAGPVVSLRVSSATADCQAPASTDAGGRRVSYEPALMSDGDPGTAWRCPGPGTGRRLVFTFPTDTRIAQVGLSNGYTKVDPESGEHRYGEYRRLREVTWTFPSGASYRQRLRDEVETVQTLRIPVQEASRVTVTVTGSTTPGEKGRNRDAVLVSEVAFAGPVG